MKALLCTRFGTPDDLVFEDVAEPVAGPGEVIVAVSHLGLNFHETLVIAGKHAIQPSPPFSPGSEFCGRIVALGEGVTGFAPGDRVAGNNDHGMARERIAFPAHRLCAVPDGIPEHLGAAIRVNYGTSYYALKQRGQLRPGETLAVLGASGGVGLAAVELGKRMGARVIACASSPERLALARDRGADETVDYARDSLKDALKRLTGGKGVDVIYDPVGGAHSEAAFRAIAWNGRHLVVGFAAGEIPRIALNLPLVKNAAILGVFVGEWMQREPDANRENLEDLFAWTAQGQLRPHVQTVLPFARMPEGLTMLARREAQGKIIVAL
jgi:NADPH:quinone reductase